MSLVVGLLIFDLTATIAPMKNIMKKLGKIVKIVKKPVMGIKKKNPNTKNINNPIITPAGLLFLDIDIFFCFIFIFLLISYILRYTNIFKCS